MANKITIQQGDTFDVTFQYKEDNTSVAFPTGYDICAGFYDVSGTEVYVAKLSNGGIEQVSDDTFVMHVPHTASATMSGKIVMELAIYDEEKTFVDFSSDNITFTFQPRKMNNRV